VTKVPQNAWRPARKASVSLGETGRWLRPIYIARGFAHHLDEGAKLQTNKS